MNIGSVDGPGDSGITAVVVAPAGLGDNIMEKNRSITTLS